MQLTSDITHAIELIRFIFHAETGDALSVPGTSLTVVDTEIFAVTCDPKEIADPRKAAIRFAEACHREHPIPDPYVFCAVEVQLKDDLCTSPITLANVTKDNGAWEFALVPHIALLGQFLGSLDPEPKAPAQPIAALAA